jgi:hypothetical protein
MITFKTARIELEFAQLKSKNETLHGIITLSADFARMEIKKDVVITSIYRSPEENKELYKDAGGPPAWQPHTVWRGVDLRSTIYTDAELQKLLAFFNLFTVFGGQRKCASVHKIAGNQLHFHVQG